MKQAYFSEDIIRFEALTKTPLKDAFVLISLDRQLDLLDGLIVDCKAFADANNLPHPDRKTWEEYKKTAQWDKIAKDAFAQKSFFKKVKKSLDKMTHIW